MRRTMKSVLGTATTVALTAGLLIAGGASAYAYQPQPSDVYVADSPDSCNKRPCVLYPKTAQLESGRIVAAFENSQSSVAGQTMPIHVSDDYGTTWRKLTDVKAPAALSTDPKYAKYTSNWTNPYLYVMPQTVGALKKGTLLLSTIVSGDDEYYNEQKAANPGWQPSGDGDRRDLAVALYSSSDDGATWSVVDIIAAGGWQGGSAGAIGRTSAANVNRQVDPLWEPHLRVIDGKLVAYYSDENDYLGVDPNTGIPILDPDNDTAPDFGNQILVHKTWDGSGAWSEPVVDVAGFTDTRNGKTQIGGGRPGMTTIAPTTDGQWMLTFEYFGGGDNVRYKVGPDPLRFFAVGGDAGANISQLRSSGPRVSAGGSPVLTTLADGRIVYNANGSASVWVNGSGRSDGVWKEYQTTVPPGYSRNLQSVDGTGRLLILQAAWAGGSVGPIKHADVDLGNSEGAYYTLINRATGQVLSTFDDKTQDVVLTGDRPDIITWSNNPANPTQRWHVQPKGANVTFLNKAGGRAMAIYFGNAVANQPLAQWVDDSASDKLWSLVPTTDGFVKIQSARNTAMFVTGSGNGGPVRLGAAISSAGNATADDAQEWQLVQEAPTASQLSPARQSAALISAETVEAGASVQLNTAVANPAGAKTHALVAGRIFVVRTDGTSSDIGQVTFDADEKARITIPESFAPAEGAKLVVQFDASAAVWDSVDITTPRPVVVTPTVTSSAPAGEAGWLRGPASVRLVSSSSTAAVQYRLNGLGEWQSAENAVDVNSEGPTSVQYRAAKDGTPVPGSEGTLDVKIDSVAPVTAPLVSPAAGTTTVGNAITARFEATDATSGVASTEVSLDDGRTWAPVPESGVSFTELGAHTVQYRASDTAGNVETARSIVLTVAAPAATAGVKITSADAPNADGWYQQSVVVALTAPTPGQKLQYRLNGGTWRNFTSSIAITTTGINTIDHRLLVGGAVVEGSSAQTVIKLDTVLPTATATRVPGSGSGTPLNPITVVLGATDKNSGVDRVEYRINDGDWTRATDEGVVLDRVGDYVLTYRTTDLAGNVSASKSLTATIKANVAPTVKASALTVTAGQPVTLTVTGFARWDDVTIALGATTVGTALTDVNGTARLTVRVPSDTAAGPATIAVTGSDGSITASAPVTVKR